MNPAAHFAAGRNIAMKVPPQVWQATVEFYRDVVGLTVVEHTPTVPSSVALAFRANQLWIDRVDGLSQAELWLELTTNDTVAAADHLRSAGVVRRDEIEALPVSFDGFWITRPASIIHLVSRPDQY